MSNVHPSRQAYVEEEEPLTLSNIPSDLNYQIPTGSGGNSTLASAVLSEHRRKREAAAIAVPTDDTRVRAALRARGEPITLFGERKEDRRDRLRELLFAAQQGDNDESMQDATSAADEGEEVVEYYTEGSPELLTARREIAKFSLPRTAKRIAYQQLESAIPVATHVEHRKGIREKLSGFELVGSQIASDRPVSMVRVSPDNQTIACGDWGGSLKLLAIEDLKEQKVLRGHRGMISGIAWYDNGPVTPLDLASGGQEGDVNLWSLEQDTPVATLSGHTARVCRTEFHPSGRYLASASYDMSWRFWDLETTTELLLQEGHSKELYTVSFNLDGSLLASAGLDSIGRVWDLRTGRNVMLLEGHVKPIHGLDWSSDGTRLLTGSADGFAKCWDLRAVRETASIGAHNGGVTDLRWFKGTDGPLSSSFPKAGGDVTMTNGDDAEQGNGMRPKMSGTFFVSSGFDKAVHIFSADDWSLCRSLTGHDGTVFGVDVTSDAKCIVSCGKDRTVKIWARDDDEGI